MASIAPLEQPSSTPPRPNLALVQPVADPDVEQLAVEHRMVHAVLVGMAIGVAVCVMLWGLVVLAALAGSGEPLLGPLLMGAAVGVFAGIFFGGWAGTLYGSHLLEVHERATEPGRVR